MLMTVYQCPDLLSNCSWLNVWFPPTSYSVSV
jgi:hypothetical protein